MEIGGVDKVLKVPFSEALVGFTLKWFRQLWPDIVWDRPKDHPEYGVELFIYEDAEAEASWDTLGYDPSNGDKMVFLTFEKDVLAVVVDERMVETADQLFAAIRSDTILFD